jgi:3-isopropylmalate/(R)-2-methylmalate dehydratase large subunit
MGLTMTEKIIAKSLGATKVAPGDLVQIKPDRVIAYDFPGYTDVWFKQLANDFNISKIADPSRFLLFIDHLTSLTEEKEIKFHDITRKWAKENNVKLIDSEGIGHHLVIEKGLIQPGQLVVHFDPHVFTVGAIGCLGFGVSRDLIEAWVSGKVHIEIPSTYRIELYDRFQPGVEPRDLIMHIVKTLGADGCINQVIEYSGESTKFIPIDSRQTLCTLSSLAGAISAIFEPDDLINSIYQTTTDKFSVFKSDVDANFASRLQIDLSSIVPLVTLPGSTKSSNIKEISDAANHRIDRGFIGSCASGRLEDIRAAASILKGRKVHPDFRLVIAPISESIRKLAQSEGYLDALIDAGAEIGQSYCDYCWGHFDPLVGEEKCISTGVLNIDGRMGSRNAKIYLASASTVAATAINGYISDPRQLLS